MLARKRSQIDKALRTAADVLSDIEALRVRLENKEEITLDLAAELEIPTDPKAMIEAAHKAPAQVAFWNYQTERALARLRKAEAALAKEEGTQLLVYRQWYLTEECEMPTGATLRARLDTDTKCRRFRVALMARKTEHGHLRAVRDAVDHRAWMLRTLIGKLEPT